MNVNPAAASETAALSWLALALTPGLGPTRARKLAEHFGSAENVFRASLTELEACGLHAAAAQAIGTGKSAELAREELRKAVDAEARILTLDDPAYPPLLRQIYDPPVAMYVRGSVDALAAPGLAVVGTRHPTPYGVGMAERLACDLAGNLGLVITSGMARGVDTAAHRGGLMGKGKTIAVFGTGIDVIYPRENQKIADSILATGGALVSELSAPSPPRRIFLSATASSAGFRWACWWWKRASTAARASPRAAPWSRIATSSPCLATSPIAIPGGQTRSSSRAPSWWPPGKTCGRTCRTM